MIRAGGLALLGAGGGGLCFGCWFLGNLGALAEVAGSF